jgi:hypothetical protein
MQIIDNQNIYKRIDEQIFQIIFLMISEVLVLMILDIFKNIWKYKNLKSKYRIIIIDNEDKMNENAQRALLKKF